MGMAWWGVCWVGLSDELCHAFPFAEHLQPPFFDIKPASVDVALGESATFKCHVTGSAPMKITWTRDNRQIRPGGNYKMTLVENMASLTVLKVGKGDAGLYTCTASNSVGKDACAAELAVQGIVSFSVHETFLCKGDIWRPKPWMQICVRLTSFIRGYTVMSYLNIIVIPKYLLIFLLVQCVIYLVKGILSLKC